MMPAASPMPNCLVSAPGLVDRTKNANIRTSAALVTSLPVRARPRPTAAGVSPVPSYASRIRVSMNTSSSIDRPYGNAKIISGIHEMIQSVAATFQISWLPWPFRKMNTMIP